MIIISVTSNDDDESNVAHYAHIQPAFIYTYSYRKLHSSISYIS